MRNRPQAILISAMIAAAALIVLVLYAISRQPAPAATGNEAVSPAPQVQEEEVDGSATAPAPDPSTKIYTDVVTGFYLNYPEAVMPTDDASDMALSGYIPVCDPNVAVACFPYAKEAYPDSNFVSAAFAVHVLKDAKTDRACLSVRNGEEADGEAKINGVVYKKFSFSDAAVSHRLDGENYRAAHEGKCFELSTRVATTVFEVYEPGTISEFTDFQRSKLQASLDAMLMSFRFSSAP